jgi:hypothetical protein
VTNPSTGKLIKIQKSQIGTKKQLKVKDPTTGEVLVVDVATGDAQVIKANVDSLETK